MHVGGDHAPDTIPIMGNGQSTKVLTVVAQVRRNEGGAARGVGGDAGGSEAECVADAAHKKRCGVAGRCRR